MKRPIFIFLLIILTVMSMSAQSTVNWYTEYDKALEVADAEGKNLFILITAPSWCIWCIRLEEDVLSKEYFQRYQSEHYISVKLLDKIDGKVNPQLDNFDFSGYPAVFLYDSQGRFIKNINTQDPDAMLMSMSNYKDVQGVFRPLLKDLKLPEKYTFTDDGGGEYTNNDNGTWTEEKGGDENLYRQTQYDFDYIYLELMGGDPEKVHVIALPMNGTDRHRADLVDDEWVWSDLDDVVRTGGDPFFD